MRKKLVDMFLLVFSVFLLSACASGPASTWKADDITGLRDLSEEQVIQKFGPPDRKSTSQAGQVFEYRKPAEKESGKNTYLAIATFGFASGKDSAYVDILRIVFKRGRVVDFNYEESAMGVSLPGGMMPSNSSKNNAVSTGSNRSEDLDNEKQKPNTQKALLPPAQSPITASTTQATEAQAAVIPAVDPKVKKKPIITEKPAVTYLVTTKSGSTVRSEPNGKSKVITTLKKGQKLKKLDQLENWYNVILSSGETGWIHKDLVKNTD